MAAYYNELDKFAAGWLRNLITEGHIAPGEVDERSIEDVTPADLRGFTQCHFFAGVGVWSYALRHAGWPDDEPVWTGSCPCQPFSAAGKGDGFADERHLWPAFHYLIEQCRPSIVFGEQVASKDAEPWIDLVQDDLEAMGYTVGAVPFASACVGAPHIRDRLYWVADADKHGCGAIARAELHHAEHNAESRGGTRGLADAHNTRLEGLGRGYQAEGGRIVTAGSVAEASEFGGMADADEQQRSGSASGSDVPGGRYEEPAEVTGLCGDSRPGPTNGYWRAADWLFCRDGKFRPVEPGTFPLVDGAPSRVGRLRAFGNAINAAQAEIFIRCVMECRP